ncbi:MAG TPA: taurine catabolism dioxygenase TauD [Blastocatellia bacterium]|nr:taurine catabolism dioxygenase TauD [Blastocatellia bacterium]
MNPDVTKPGSIKRKAIALTEDGLIKESLLRADTRLPLLLEPAVDGLSLPQWAAGKTDFIAQKLRSNGGILFRGFNVNTVDEFELFLRSLIGDLFHYSYRSTPRTQVSGHIYTSTEYPQHQTILLHNEMSYSRSWPMVIGFFCLEASPEGGETPIADSRKVFNAVDPAIRDRFSEKGVMYVRNYGDALDLSWQNVFQTEDRAEVEAYCRKAGIECEWKGENELRTRQVCQAVATHPHTGEKVWFNQAHLFHVSSLAPEIRESLLASAGGEPPRNAYYGDGSPIDEDALEGIRAAYANEAVVFPWEKSDILVLDNMLTAHGRRPYRGGRRIVVGMG